MSTVLITGAATGIGRLSAIALARAGHTVHATMREPEGRNATRAQSLRPRLLASTCTSSNWTYSRRTPRTPR
ncbi:SDR family NAD(P)-dependent oxidoreductase [Streptomyces graminifolii]|uniref:SDR family NAD(P)-dependent oxidoreductase n=1 Tax=Streptomyces graminifolii TaxID=1266771 RepID=UPI004057EDF3